MALNKNLFSTYFEYKDYNRCISMLREEIIHILVKRVQEKNSDYKYTTISNLKLACFKYLTEVEQEVSIGLYDFSFNEEATEFELSRMMELYKLIL